MKKNLKILFLSILILLSIVLDFTGLSKNIGASYAYIIKPLFWIFIGIITFFFFKNDVIVNNKYKKDVNFVVLVATLIYFLCYFALGYIKGFAHNPFDTSIKGLLTNLWTFIPMLFVREYIRYYMINNCNKKHILWSTLFISLMFVLAESNIYKYDVYFKNSITTLAFIMETFIPSLLTNLFLTYIVYFAGYQISIFYAFLPQFALYALPILPDVDLSTLAILNSSIPFFTYIYINYMINKIDKTLDRKKEKKSVDIKGLIFMILIVIVMVCFGIGMFPYMPLVIASDSMYPEIKKGDIVIIKDTKAKDAVKGETIRYRMDNYYVVHRIKEIKEDEDGNRIFITKGDNNRDIDLYPVKESQFAGSVKYKIPYLGWPTLILNEILNTNVGDQVRVDKGKIN